MQADPQAEPTERKLDDAIERGEIQEKVKTEQQSNEEFQCVCTREIAMKWTVVGCVVTLGLTSFIIGCVVLATSRNSLISTYLTQLDLSTLTFMIGLSLLLLSILPLVSLYRRLLYGLHIYWILLLILLIFILFIGVSAGGVVTGDCSSGVSAQMEVVSQAADGMFCSAGCPCTNDTTVRSCPGWQQNLISPFLTAVQSKLVCSGWCNQSKLAVSAFGSPQYAISAQTQTCFSALQGYLSKISSTVKGICIVMCILLVITILVVNVYVFLSGEDEQQEMEQNKIKESKKLIEDGQNVANSKHSEKRGSQINKDVDLQLQSKRDNAQAE